MQHQGQVMTIFSEKSLVVSGIDEAGRGPLAGPVTAAAVVLNADYKNPRIRDSKKLNHSQREKLFEEIILNSLCYSIINIDHQEIDKHNIRQATLIAMRKAAQEIINTFPKASFLIDGNMTLGESFCSEAIVKGDDKLTCISAASILAKVSRDRQMGSLDQLFPNYGFAKHKGYPTKDHREAIRKLGPCSIHRRTFAGVKEFV